MGQVANGIPNPLIQGSPALAAANGVTSAIEVVAASANGASLLIARLPGASANPGALYFLKSRGSVSAPYTVVAQNDLLGTISFEGSDGTQFRTACQLIPFIVDPTPGPTSMAGGFDFRTTPIGSVTSVSSLQVTSASILSQGVPITMSGNVIVSAGSVVRPNNGLAIIASDATATFSFTPGTSQWSQQLTLPITATRTVTLVTAGALTGDTADFTRDVAATGAFNWVIGALKNLTPGTGCTIKFNGTAWVLWRYWTL